MLEKVSSGKRAVGHLPFHGYMCESFSEFCSLRPWGSPCNRNGCSAALSPMRTEYTPQSAYILQIPGFSNSQIISAASQSCSQRSKDLAEGLALPTAISEGLQFKSSGEIE